MIAFDAWKAPEAPAANPIQAMNGNGVRAKPAPEAPKQPDPVPDTGPDLTAGLIFLRRNDSGWLITVTPRGVARASGELPLPLTREATLRDVLDYLSTSELQKKGKLKGCWLMVAP
jgi:hypothetical protein